MQLETVFHISIYSLVALAGGMLAYGEETPLPSALTVVLSVLAMHLNERLRTIRIGVLTSNVLGLAAAAAAVFELFDNSPEARLLAGAHFLVYMTWIVLFQDKEIRQYWWLTALSLLQVAVGSVLAFSRGWYGVLLLAYLLLALWTLSVFTLYQGAFEFGIIRFGRRRETRPGPAGDRWMPGTVNSQSHDAALAAALVRGIIRSRRSDVYNSIQQDSPGRWIAPRFAFGVLGLAVAGITLGLAIFLFVPRFPLGSDTQYPNESRQALSLTGFSNDVRLGQIGEILERTDRVLRVKLIDHDSEKPIDIENFVAQGGLEDPMFRGSVLESYYRGRWTGWGGERPEPMRPHLGGAGLVRQEYTLDQSASECLFAMRPITSASFTRRHRRISTQRDTGVLSGRRGEDRDPFQYIVFSRPLPKDTVPSGRGLFSDLPRWTDMSGPAKNRSLRWSRPDLERLAQLASDVAAPGRRLKDEKMSYPRWAAEVLQAHLRDSGNYQYSLSMAVDDPTIDPVEDFLFNRKRGHCEYFASALALMLRVVEIPSRVITGFKGVDDYHGSDGHYEVQQRHAHAWVEAWVDDEWIVLDPTPGMRDEKVRSLAAERGFWSDARNSISSLWSDYVVSLSLSRQQQSLYDPLQGSMTTGWSSIREVLKGMALGSDWFKNVISSPEEVLGPRGTAAGLIFLACLVVVVAIVRRFLSRKKTTARSWRRRLTCLLDWILVHLTGRHRDPAHRIVVFFDRFQSLVSSAGHRRRTDQTQREFARQVEVALADRLARAGLNRFPSQLAEFFYRVRFGAGLLEPVEALEVEQRLARLKRSLTSNGG